VDCYPRTFQPTKDFQVIHDDQDLPPGLHVRMNIYTGLKEARLNIPIEDGEEVLDVHTEQAVVIVPQADEGVVDDAPTLRDRVPQKPPVYESAGKIQPPREESGGDSEDFHRALNIIKLGGEGEIKDKDLLNTALVTLFELSHDIYYGLELMKRGDILQILVILMTEDSDKSGTAHTRRQAASILANSVQNNPTALKESRASWKGLMKPSCDGDLGCEGDELITKVHQSLSTEQDPIAMKAKIYSLHGLTKDSGIRDIFLSEKGMDTLLLIFQREGSEWDAIRVKIAQFVMDTFLDENMGAELGIWPTKVNSDTQWKQQLEKMGRQKQTSEGEEWVDEFLRLLKSSNEDAGGARHNAADREL